MEELVAELIKASMFVPFIKVRRYGTKDFRMIGIQRVDKRIQLILSLVLLGYFRECTAVSDANHHYYEAHYFNTSQRTIT